MSLKALFYAYILGGVTFLPLVLAALVYFTIYTAVPVGDPDVRKKQRAQLEHNTDEVTDGPAPLAPSDINDAPKTRKTWLTVRRTFEESSDGGYVTLVRSFLDARSKDPKRSRPKDMWYVVLKGKVMYLYEDEAMTECEAAIELGGHDVTIYPEGLQDGELFAKRNAICLKSKIPPKDKALPSVTKEMHFEGIDVDAMVAESGAGSRKAEKVREAAEEEARQQEAAREQAMDIATPWFIFVRSNVEMEDWYFALIHASDNPPQTPLLAPLQPIFQPGDLNYLVNTLDEQPDVIPMRWLNAFIGRVFFSFYRTHNLEAEIIRRLMKKLSKVKRPTFLTDINVTEVSVGNKAPTFSKPMLKELTKEGEASMEVHLQYKGEVRITVEATASINLGSRFKSYTVKLVLAVVLKEIEGNLLVKIKRPPSNRIWYAFTQTPRMVFDVEPIVSDRQITWSMITSTLESSMKSIIQESVVMPNMDDISFFESSGYSHRGGIWADTARREKPPTSVSQQSSDDDAGSVASAPLPHDPSSDADASGFRGTQSAAELPVSSSPLDGSDPSWSSSFSSGEEAARLNRRRSWFSSARSDDGRPLAEQDLYAEGEDAPRGRPMDMDKSQSLRSRSTPHPSDPTPPRSSEGSDESHLRPPSQASSMREHSKSNSEEYTGPASEPSTSFSKSSPTASSFLSTLRSRDKQAISSTAKETIRKWGANWSGLMKDRDSGSNAGDEVPDHGSLLSRLRTEHSSNSTPNKRQSYAEVRAAVAERRGRGSDGSGSSTRQPSSPIPIPHPDVRERAVTMLPGQPAQNGFTSRLPRPTTDNNSNNGTPNRGSPSPAMRAGTDLQPPSTPSTPSTPSPSPVRVQPQAKTMTIPGIHASHRGDVMSMGYVAPDPPSPFPDARVAKNPAIQSMYRLWKSPAAAAEMSTSAAAATPDLDPAVSSSSSSSSSSLTHSASGSAPVPLVAPFSSTDSPSSIPSPATRPMPPPLPPRHVRTPSLSQVARPELDPPRLSESLQSSASETLQSIANKDKDKRASLELASPPASRRATLSGAGAEQTASSGGDDELPDPPLSSSRLPPPLPPRRPSKSQ
ncbi:hypothetical protein GGX14DRAFT_655987 [Mycena pura]|uniref:SMP-LTD domain-containing protein n=1 Tax=Mycena pura TaxID=153505 RepID=A0AAD6V3B2_9AGAR|nr:hypothetical protein GGX14DRAFT_655987 [Mycena pura]